MDSHRLLFKTICVGSLLLSACNHPGELNKKELIEKFRSELQVSANSLDVQVVAICNTKDKHFPFKFSVTNFDTVLITCSDKLYSFDHDTVNPMSPNASGNASLYPEKSSAMASGASSHSSKNGMVFVVSCYEGEEQVIEENDGVKTIEVQKISGSRSFHFIEEIKCSNK